MPPPKYAPGYNRVLPTPQSPSTPFNPPLAICLMIWNYGEQLQLTSDGSKLELRKPITGGRDFKKERSTVKWGGKGMEGE